MSSSATTRHPGGLDYVDDVGAAQPFRDPPKDGWKQVNRRLLWGLLCFLSVASLNAPVGRVRPTAQGLCGKSKDGPRMVLILDPAQCATCNPSHGAAIREHQIDSKMVAVVLTRPPDKAERRTLLLAGVHEQGVEREVLWRKMMRTSRTRIMQCAG